jgi:hypothetical protein
LTNPCVRARARQEKAYEKAKAGYLQAALGGIVKCRWEINQKLDRLMKTSESRTDHSGAGSTPIFAYLCSAFFGSVRHEG